MRVTYSGVIAASPDDAWARVSDIDLIIGLLPGATLKREGDGVVGSLKVRPSAQVTYRITCGASPEAEADKTATIAVTGAEARGDGTLAATVTVAVRQEDGGSGLSATADIEATGRAAEADEHGWTKVLSGLGNAVVASFERYPPGTPVPQPEPPAAKPAPAPKAAPTPKPVPAPAPAAPVPTAAPALKPVPAASAVAVAEPPPAPSPPTPAPARAVEAPPQSKVPMLVGAIVVLIVLRWILKRRK